jgi:LuxR family transcriptional regulator, maltose regulon positive regulatory protein
VVEKFAIPLVKTKLFIPQIREARVRRPRLITELNKGLNYPLILLSSLPGSGKTTLLADWISQLHIPAAWVSLEANDNETARFLRYFIAALQSIFPEIGKTSLEELNSSEALSYETIFSSLINNLSDRKSEFIFVLDDFHVIHSRPIQSAIAYYIDHQPPQAHLVIATRADPIFPLSRLRTRNRILELRIDDLRFTDSEISEYLNRIMGLELGQDDLSALEARTEGWIASLQMTALSLKHTADPQGFIQAFSGSNRYVMDYLVEEVLDQQPKNVQNFLLQTSILERLNGLLCNTVCFADPKEDEQKNNKVNPAGQGQEMLEFLERSNLFIIPLDEERKWYRYHHLFASLLRSQLVHSNAATINALHLRAADWFETNGYPEDAIHHALAAQDFPHAANLVERIAESAWINGQYSRLAEWIQALPVDLVLSKPWLCIWNAWTITQTGVLKEANAWIEAAEAAVQKLLRKHSGSSETPPELHALSYEISALKVLTACLEQDYDLAIQLSVGLLETPLPKENKLSQMARCHILHGLSYKYFTDGDFIKAEQYNLETIRLSQEIGFTLRQLHGTNKLAYVYNASGQLQRCYRLIQNTLTDLQEQGLANHFAAVAMHCRLVDLLYVWDQLTEAETETEIHIKPELCANVPYLLVDVYNIRARNLLLIKDLSTSQDLLNKASSLIHQFYIWDGLAWQTETLQVRLWLLAGDITAATTWAAGLPNIPTGSLAFSIESRELCRARVLLATGDFRGALGLLGRLESGAKAGQMPGSLVAIETLTAVALLTAGQPEQAVAALEQALSLAKPEGYKRTILDEGQPVTRLLAHIARDQRSPHRIDARQLLEKTGAVTPEDSAQVVRSSLIEPLSSRELEVLGCLAAGLTNPETAQKLVIETATVKRHVNSIFAKLGVNNRVQAINTAKKYKII